MMTMMAQKYRTQIQRQQKIGKKCTNKQHNHIVSHAAMWNFWNMNENRVEEIFRFENLCWEVGEGEIIRFDFGCGGERDGKKEQKRKMDVGSSWRRTFQEACLHTSQWANSMISQNTSWKQRHCSFVFVLYFPCTFYFAFFFHRILSTPNWIAHFLMHACVLCAVCECGYVFVHFI